MMEIQRFSNSLPDFNTFVSLRNATEIPPKAHFYHGVLVKALDRTLASAVLYLNTDIVFEDKITGFIGAFEAEDNPEGVSLLFAEIEQIAKALGLNFLIGPMDGSTWENYRYHDSPALPLFLMEMEHPGYYPTLWMQSGFRPISSYYSSESFELQHDDEAVSANRARLAREGIHIHSIELSRYEEELDNLYPFLLNAFASNFLYSPLSATSFKEKYLSLQKYLDPDFVLLAKHGERTVGVFFCVQDFLDQAQKTLIIKTIARDPAPLYSGLGHVMAAQVYQTANARGYTRIIHAFLKENGTSTPISKKFFGTPFKTYSLYGKAI